MERNHPVQPLPRPARPEREGRRTRRRGLPAGIRNDFRVGWHFHGARGDALFPRLPGRHRRLGRDRHDGRTTGRFGDARGRRQIAARLDLASVFIYAGSIMPGWVKLEDGSEKEVTIIDAFEAVGACARGLMSREDVGRIERAICPGEGACGGMYTANTMASVAEAMGMSLPGSAAPPSADRRRDNFSRLSGEAVVNMLRLGITSRDIMTKEAFENAIAVTMAFGGSTNAVLHLLA